MARLNSVFFLDSDAQGFAADAHHAEYAEGAPGDSDSWDEAGDELEPLVSPLYIDGDTDASSFVTVGSGAQREALRITLSQNTSGSECLVLDVVFEPRLNVQQINESSLVHFTSFHEFAKIVPGFTHQRRLEEGNPCKRRAVCPSGTPQRVPVAALSACSFKGVRLGPLILQIETRKHFGALMRATVKVFVNDRLAFEADYSSVPCVHSPAEVERRALHATLDSTLDAQGPQRFRVAVYSEGEPAVREEACGRPPLRIARAPWQADIHVDSKFRETALEFRSMIAHQDAQAALRRARAARRARQAARQAAQRAAQRAARQAHAARGAPV
jgi:hypothetical protein